MRALQIFVIFSILSSALANVDVDEIVALTNIRSHLGLDKEWPDRLLLKTCSQYLPYVTCTEGHITKIDFGSSGNRDISIGTLGNITGLRYLNTLYFSPSRVVCNLDDWYTQLPNLTSLRFLAYYQTPNFSANFTQNPLLAEFWYEDEITSVLPWTILGPPGLKSLKIRAPRLIRFPSDFLAGMNLTYLSFSFTGYNSLSPLVYPDISHLTHLDTLDLGGTPLSQLQEDFFSALKNLRVLLLDNGRLLKLPSSLSLCTKLEAISCQHCKLNQADSIPNLSSTRLNRLDLFSNQISSWPDFLCQLSSNPAAPGLTLELSYNALPDPPACFASTTQLYSISFVGTKFTSFPSFLANMSSLTSLTIYDAPQMVGYLPDLSGLPLVTLNVGGELVGSFPTNLPTSLTTLRLFGNNFTGTIPDDIFSCFSSLSILDLSGNRFYGAFPSSINMTKVRALIGMNNAFTSLPDSIGTMKPLYAVSFSNNNLSSIPSDNVWENITTLSTLDLRNNRHLSGPLPVFWSKPESWVSTLDLSGCSFTGNVPSLNSTKLVSITLSDNALDGTIMPSQAAPDVRIFRVDRNLLSGTIPPSLAARSTGFYYPWTIDFSFNRLTGSIPSTFQRIFDESHVTEFSFNNNWIDGSLPNLTLAKNILIFKGDHTKVRLCDANLNIRPQAQCTLNDVEFSGACGCASWYTTCTTNTTCPSPGYSAPVDPPGTTAPTPILPPSTNPLVAPGELPLPISPATRVAATCPVRTVPSIVDPTSPPQGSSNVSAGSALSTSLTILVLVSVLGATLL